MKIYVDKIPEQGVEITGQIERGLLLLDTEAISFINPIDVKAKAFKTGNELFVDIALEVGVEYTCSKCLCKFEDIFKKRFNMVRKVTPAEIVEIDDEIRQEIILDYPLRIVCKPDCKGLCPNCGQNLNVGKCECNT